MEPEKASEGLTKLELKKIRRLEKKKSRKAAAEELRKKCVRDHLKREQNFSLETERRVFKDWEQMCTDVKYKELLEEMLQIKQNIQMIFDRKNTYIERLFSDRAELEDIYSKNLQRLKHLIDCYLDIHQYFVTNLFTQYKEDCISRIAEFHRDTDLQENQASECLQQMEGAVISLEEAIEQGLIDDRVDFIKKNDENINSHIEKRDRLRDQKVEAMELVHGEIKAVLSNYFSTILHPEKEKAFQNLYNKDEGSRMIIQSNRAKIRELQLCNKYLTKKITEVEIAGARKIITKKLIKRNLEEEMDTLKRKISRVDVDHMHRMKEISYEVFHIEKYLTDLLERGKLILSLAQTCSKYECEDDVKYFKNRIEQGHTTDNDVGNPPPEYAFLFGKINRVKVINLLLREERERLLQANRELQHQFQEYCQLNSLEANIARLKPTVRSVELGDRQK